MRLYYYSVSEQVILHKNKSRRQCEYPTYINSTKKVKCVCVGKGGFLSSLPVLCDKRHGLHGEL